MVQTFTGLTDPYGVAANGTYIAVAERSAPGDVAVLNESSGSVGVTITGRVTDGAPPPLQPRERCLRANGDLYIADTYNDRILAYSLSS